MDISQELLQKVKDDFAGRVNESDEIKKFISLVRDGKATFTQTQHYARELGELLGESLRLNVTFDILPDSKLYKEIAEPILNEMLKGNHALVVTASKEVQRIQNKKDGISLGTIEPEINQDRIDGIIKNITQEGITEIQLSERLFNHVVNFTESVFDDFIRENADFLYQCGLYPKIVRTCKCDACGWCKNLAGIYNYGDVSDAGNDVFRRHSDCHCVVTYENGKKSANVHTKEETSRVLKKILR